MKICCIIGTRPQIIKQAALQFALEEYAQIACRLIHTQQHYDKNMSHVFFDDLDIAKPDYTLEVGSHSHATQTALMMQKLEPILIDEQPDYLIVYGDTNSTLAGTLVAAKLNIRIVHIEAGLRSHNMLMPEEVNRVITDRLAHLAFAPSESAMQQLMLEGLEEIAHLSGDIMKDLVRRYRDDIPLPPISALAYYYSTIHRPYNTDNQDRITEILHTLNELPIKVIFSLHPRTKAFLTVKHIDLDYFKNIHFISPVSYTENLAYINGAVALITDSGGMQKEAYWLQTRCVTIRSETEWIETLANDCNQLLFTDVNRLAEVLESECGSFEESLYGNGNAASYIIETLLADFKQLGPSQMS